MTRRPAFHRDESEHPLRGQRHGVGRGQVVGHQDERCVALRHARQRLTEQSSDGPVANVVKVANALGHVAAEIEEQRPERLEGAVDGPRRRFALGRRGSDCFLERRVAGDHRGRFEYLGRARDGGEGRPPFQVIGCR